MIHLSSNTDLGEYSAASDRLLALKGMEPIEALLGREVVAPLAQLFENKVTQMHSSESRGVRYLPKALGGS